MTARLLLPLGLGAAGLLVLVALCRFGQPVLPSYLSAWLFVLACPLGALPLVMGSDLLGHPETPAVAALRAMLPLTVLAAAMAVPVVVGRAALYPTMATDGTFAAAWTTPGAILGRGLAAGLAWLLLALVFRRPAPPRTMLREPLAGLGLVLHLVFGTLVVGDWVGAIDPALASASLGLTVLVAQAGVALSVAALLTLRRNGVPVRGLALAILWVFGAWLFMHFTQYLVVWSANLPTEVPWYISRDGGFGGVAEAGAGLVFLVALPAVLLWPSPRVVAALAAAILLVHLVEMFWLVVPVGRGTFSLGLADLAAAIGLVGLAAAALAILRPATGAGLEAQR